MLTIHSITDDRKVEKVAPLIIDPVAIAVADVDKEADLMVKSFKTDTSLGKTKPIVV